MHNACRLCFIRNPSINLVVHTAVTENASDSEPRSEQPKAGKRIIVS